MNACREPQAHGPIDLPLLVLTAFLVGFGLLMVYSSSTILAMNQFGDSYYFIKRQLIWSTVGGMTLWFLAITPYSKLRAWVLPGLGLSLVLLVAVLLLSIGRTSGGARRWFSLGWISFQPAELLKLVLVIYLADALARKEAVMTSFRQGLVPPLVVLAAASGLLLLQPDLGTVIMLGLVGVTMLWSAGARPAHLLGLFLAAVPLMTALILTVGYRKRRLDAFFNPWSEPLGKGFQIVQSFLALGSGGLWGRGLCESQQKLFYLPAPHTDFIFSIVGEELGFAGAFVLLGLFALLVWKGFAISRDCPDRFGKLLALGLTTLLGVQACVNMGVTTGLLPTKGTTLPFISAGGSSVFFSLAAVGMLLSISRSFRRSENA